MGDDEKVAGIVSERDLIRAIGQAGPKVFNDPVSDFMTEKVVTAREADTVDRLMSEITTHQFRHMPVVEMGRLIGIVSIGDLVKMHVADAEFESGAMRQYITTANTQCANRSRLYSWHRLPLYVSISSDYLHLRGSASTLYFGGG